MAMTNGTPESLSTLDTSFGWISPGSDTDLKDVLTELQGFRISMVKGAAQSTLTKVLAVGGISSGTADNIVSTDVILGAVEFDIAAAASGLTDVSIRNDVRVASTTGYVQFSGAATTGSFILLFWYDNTGFIAQ